MSVLQYQRNKFLKVIFSISNAMINDYLGSKQSILWGSHCLEHDHRLKLSFSTQPPKIKNGKK